MFRTLGSLSFQVLGVAFALRLSCDGAHSSNESKNTNVHRGVGLLSGVKNVEESVYYSRKLSLEAASNLLSDKKYIYNSALEDIDGDESKFDEYLSNINEKKRAFIKKETIWNRVELKETLRKIVEQQEGGGVFACLLGGKNTGKSLILHDMEKSHLDNVFIVNLRENPSILQGLIDVLQERHDPKYEELIEKFTTDMAASRTIDAADDKMGIKTNVDEVLTSLNDDYKERLTLQKLIRGLLEKVPGVITIVIDEANIAFTPPPASGRADKKKFDEAVETLALFTTLTKESRRLNVILASSEHAFPFKISDAFKFKIGNMNKFIYAGEVSPKEMFTLLTTQWGVRENLAMALISHYGGHIYDVDIALEDLSYDKSSFIAMDPDMTESVIECLERQDVDKEGMIDTLNRLAVDGFVPLTRRKDPLARVISEYNVGGVVPEKSNPMGVPKDAWEKCKYGLVPSKQSMRLAIAEELQNRKKLSQVERLPTRIDPSATRR